MWHKDNVIKTSPINNKDNIHNFPNEIQASDEQREKFNQGILRSSIIIPIETKIPDSITVTYKIGD